MVYLEPAAFGWRPLLTSWLTSLHPALLDQQALILALVDWLVEPCLQLVLRKLKELVVTSESNLTRSLMYLFQMSMSSICDDEKASKDKNFKSIITVSTFKGGGGATVLVCGVRWVGGVVDPVHVTAK
jgi:dynein heavy chain